jgi:hypothetical protein
LLLANDQVPVALQHLRGAISLAERRGLKPAFSFKTASMLCSIGRIDRPILNGAGNARAYAAAHSPRREIRSAMGQTGPLGQIGGESLGTFPRRPGSLVSMSAYWPTAAQHNPHHPEVAACPEEGPRGGQAPPGPEQR